MNPFERAQPSDLDQLVTMVRLGIRRHIVAGLLGGAVLYALTFIAPSWYRSTALLLPPDETEQLNPDLGIQRFLSRMPSLTSLTNYYTPADVHFAILNSRTAHVAVIERFGLQSVYRQKNLEEALREFRRHLKLSLNPDGTISVSFEDRNRERAAAIANALVTELDHFNLEKRSTQGRRSRVFLEERVAVMDSASKVAEGRLRAYQVSHRVVAPLEAEAMAAQPMADLMARQISLQIEAATLSTYVRADNERLRQVREDLAQVDRQITRLPAIQNELARLVRDVKLYQQAYSMLVVQLEGARMRERLDTPTVTVLDPGVPAMRQSRPIRRVWAGGGALLAVLTSVLLSAYARSRPPGSPAEG